MATSTMTERPVSALAIVSLVLGFLAISAFFIPLLPLLPALLAIVFGIIGIRQVNRGTASGKGMAVAGIILAVLGMIPTLIIVLIAIAGIGMGIAESDAVLEEVAEFGMDRIGQTGPAGVTLQIARSDFFKDTEAYDIHQNMTNISGGSSSSGVERKKFDFHSSQVKYTGTLETTSPKHLTITMTLENEVPFQLGIEGINEVAAQEEDQPLSLDEPIQPGTHTITITGTAP